MSAGADGVVTIYPLPSPPGESGIPGTIIHESGHTWSRSTWGDDTTQGKWIEWQAAMDSDKVTVSGYARKSPDEDVAETIQVYVSTQGTPQFDEYRSLIPHPLPCSIASTRRQSAGGSLRPCPGPGSPWAQGTPLRAINVLPGTRGSSTFSALSAPATGNFAASIKPSCTSTEAWSQ